MKKLFISCLVLLGSLSAHAYYHDEYGRATVTATGCTLGGFYVNDGATCVKNQDNSVSIGFGSPYQVMPYCRIQAESPGTAYWITPSPSGFMLQTVSGITATLFPIVFNYDCLAY